MQKTIEWVGSGNAPYEFGLYLGIALTLLSLGSTLKTPIFEFQRFDWLFVFLTGISVFFFFMAIRLNTEIRTNINRNGKTEKTFQESIIYFDRFNVLSKSCFFISAFMLITALIRLVYLFFI